MKKITLILFPILILMFSCEDDTNEQPENSAHSTFKINDITYKADNTILYQTKFGQIIAINGIDFELLLNLSDTDNSIFEITDTLKVLDSGKARCILKFNNDYKFSSSGTIEYNRESKTGEFSINIEELVLENGYIRVDSVITHAIVDFTVITETDEQGAAMNSGDPYDWNIRINWDLIERLFLNLKTLSTSPNDIEIVEYPNPFDDIIHLHLDISQEKVADLFIVNNNFEIEQKLLGLQGGRYSLLLDNPDYSGNYYRLYYKIYSESDEYFGSGDLKVK
ncbi:MAG: hypothetical protein KAT68_00950 [Bacteroidales bacterium]|nr:hypothetical protein [Bacteroidales bacterium]